MRTRTITFEEIPHAEHSSSHTGKKVRTIHQFEIPELTETGGYRAITSVEAFRHGQRKAASKKDKAHHRSACNWGPQSLFIDRSFTDEWEISFEGHLRASQTCERIRKEKEMPEEPSMIERMYGGDFKTIGELPKTKHADLAAFFKAIGFDTKKRRYVDAKGTPVKYSVVPE
jgi:hypothetical protein